MHFLNLQKKNPKKKKRNKSSFSGFFLCKNTNDCKLSNYSSKLTNTTPELLTSDDVIHAGGSTSTNNTSYYLHTGTSYWINDSKVVNTNGVVETSSSTKEIRPVINLKLDVIFKNGDGTFNTPYTIK